MKQKAICPECRGSDLDHFPDTAKYAYCYTCKQSVQVHFKNKEGKEQ
jgi:hypothetical protein